MPEPLDQWERLATVNSGPGLGAHRPAHLRHLFPFLPSGFVWKTREKEREREKEQGHDTGTAPLPTNAASNKTVITILK